jgi:hypothetical protein
MLPENKKTYKFIMVIIGNMYHALLFGFFQYSGRTAVLLIIHMISLISLDTSSTSTLTSKDVIQNDIIGLINCMKSATGFCWLSLM